MLGGSRKARSARRACPSISMSWSPDASPIWQKVHADLFADAPIDGADGVIALDTPKRAEDAAIVPIAIHPGFAQSPIAASVKPMLAFARIFDPVASLGVHMEFLEIVLTVCSLTNANLCED